MKILGLASLFGVGLLVCGQLAMTPATYEVIEHEAPAAGEQVVEPEVFEFLPPVDAPVSESSTGTSAKENTEHGGSIEAVSLNFSSHEPIAFELLALLNPANTLLLQVAQTQTGQSAEQPSNENSQAVTQSERRFVSLSGGKIKLDVAQWPIIGKQDAKYVFVEMFDYTCDHCRRTHTAISGAKDQLGDDLAVIVLPVPLNTKCNSEIVATGPNMAEACEIAQLAIAVWRVDPAKLAEIHNFLMTTPAIATYAEAHAKAQTIVDAELLTAELAKPTAGQYIGQHVELYKRVGSGTVPKILFPNTTVVGEFTSPDSLVEIIRKQLD